MSTLTRQELGYRFYPAVDSHMPGHPQLDIVMHATPTDEHFDPEQLICRIATSDKPVSLHVLHPWTEDSTYKICAGDVIIEDRKQQHLTAFTFGGTLTIDSNFRRTICTITSPVPLLEYSEQPSPLDQQLIDEANILFAERRAAQDEDTFAQRLAAADPVQLYQACLLALHAKFKHFPTPDDEPHRDFKHFLETATATIKEDAPTLADLL